MTRGLLQATVSGIRSKWRGTGVALRFLVRRPELFTIPKASSPEHAAENARAGDIRLTEAEIEEIDRAFPLGRRPSVLPTL